MLLSNNSHILVLVRGLLIWLGKRRIDGWECTGDAVINEFFVRLTPDRQSKTGACWSQFGISNKDWVTTIKFRISGQVKFIIIPDI